MRAIRCGVLMAALILTAVSCSSTRELSTATTATTPTTGTAATASTGAPDTTSDTATPDTTAPSDTTATSAPTTEPATTEPATTSTPAPTSTTSPPAPSRPIAAIDDNGDAVIVALDGSKTVLFDGTDPDDPPPSEGDVTSVNGVALLDDLSLAFISDCCEPVPGTMFRTVPPAPASYSSGFVGYGNSPALSPDQTRLVRPVYDQLVVSDLDLNDVATVSFDLGTTSVYEAIFLDADTVVALTFGPADAGLTTYDIAGGALVPVTSSAVIASLSSTTPSFAGTGDGVFYLAGLAPNTLSAFSMATLTITPSADITLPGQPLSAWVHAGEVRWVGADRVLHVGDLVVPGAFIWVR